MLYNIALQWKLLEKEREIDWNTIVAADFITPLRFWHMKKTKMTWMLINAPD